MMKKTINTLACCALIVPSAFAQTRATTTEQKTTTQPTTTTETDSGMVTHAPGRVGHHVASAGGIVKLNWLWGALRATCVRARGRRPWKRHECRAARMCIMAARVKPA